MRRPPTTGIRWGGFRVGLTVAVALTGLAACTSAGPAPIVTSPSTVALPRLDGPATLATATDTSFDAEAQSTMADLGITVATETRQDAYGTWNPLTIPATAPVLAVDPDVPSPHLDAALWTPDIVAQAWRDLAQFIVSEYIDSELVWDDTDANRVVVSDRIGATGFHNPGVVGEPWAYLGYLDGTSMAGPFPMSSFMMGATPFGPWALDQDWRSWRQNGPPADYDYRGNEIYRDRLAATVAPATPAPYQPGQPRTWVTRLALRSVTPSNERPNVAYFWVEYAYSRPIEFTATGTRGYELSNGSLTIKLASVDGHAYLVGYLGGDSSDRYDRGMVDLDSLRRLALLPGTPAPPDPATAASGPTDSPAATGTDTSADTPSSEASSPDTKVTRARVGPVSFDLPEGVTRDNNHSCGSPTDYAGTVRLAYDLPPTALGGSACFTVGRNPAGDDWFTGWWIYPATTTWGVATEDFVGAVDITPFAHWDEIALEFYDGRGGEYSFDLTVPAGTGQEAAARLINSLRYEVDAPTSPPVSAATPTGSATP